jgi:hypothetical protein
MIGQQTVSVMLYIIGLFCLILVFLGRLEFMQMFLIIISIVFTMFGLLWINYLVSYNRLGPLINRISPTNEIVWIRITKDKQLVFQIAKKGVYGQTKGVNFGKKADVIDKGDFPIRCLNGNNAMLTWDKISHNVNPDEAVAWKQLFKQHKVSSGKEAYKKAKKVLDRV